MTRLLRCHTRPQMHSARPHMHACTHARACTQAHTHTHTHTQNKYSHAHAHLHAHTHAHTHTHTHTHTYTHTHTHIHKNTHKQTNKHTQINRKTNRRAYTHANARMHLHRLFRWKLQQGALSHAASDKLLPQVMALLNCKQSGDGGMLEIRCQLLKQHSKPPLGSSQHQVMSRNRPCWAKVEVSNQQSLLCT